VIVYDNINFKDVKRDERLGHTSEMRSMTTAAIVHCPELPSSGLEQSMHNPTLPLSVRDIFNAPGINDNDGLGLQITKALIADAIKRLHPTAVGTVFSSSDDYPKIPPFQIIDTVKNPFWQFGAIYENEGTIGGTYTVHDSIFLRQLGLNAPDSPEDVLTDDFHRRLWLVHGDQLTSHHIRAVKSEQSHAMRSYDRRDWMLGIPAWFHVQMNLLNTIVRTHWGPVKEGESAHHCLKVDIDTWNRSCTSRSNAKYHQLEPLVVQGFTARVAALFYAAMRRRHLIHPNLKSDDDAAAAISKLSPTHFNSLVEAVRLAAFTVDAWSGDGHSDTEFRTMCRMLQEVELFLTVRHAVKCADIGLLRRVVDPLIVMFFGASQHNYGMEMLFYRWLLSPVNSPQLQHAILASGLVNWLGREKSHKPIDLSLEHLNGACKIEMKCYKNSTHDIDTIFNRVCLTNTWVRALREKLEEAFGQPQSGQHTLANAIQDMFLVANNIFASDLAEPRSEAQLASFPNMFNSFDIRAEGMKSLARNVVKFNKHNVRRRQVTMPYMPPAETSDNAHLHGGYDEQIADIEEHAYYVDASFDDVAEPIIDSDDWEARAGWAM
jgi:hypothetical protein